MRKTYVLDTSALISDPSAFKFFKDSDVIIPVVVLNELDKLKKQPGEAGKNARVCIKFLDELTDDKDISQGIEIDDNIKVIIDSQHYTAEKVLELGFGDPTYGDTQILMCAYEWWMACYNQNVVLVTNDINLRLKARARGIASIQHESNYSFDELYSGVCIVEDEDAGEELQSNNIVDPRIYGMDLFPNQSVIFVNENDEIVSSGRKISSDKLKVTKKYTPWGLSSRNIEQSLAIDLVMDRRIDLITLVGSAGTGKTLIALASALELVYNKREYSKLVIYRPFQAVSNDVGYLPGPQPLDAKILTPSGWTTMGELKVNDMVIGRDGQPTKVLGIYPKGTKSVFKITTSDGLSTEACEDHLWVTSTKTERASHKSSIKNTKEIAATLDKNHHIPRNEAVVFDKKELPIDPYLLGVYLGDGGSMSSHFTIYSADQEIIDKITPEIIKHNCHVKKQKSNKLSFRVYPNEQIGKAGAKNVKLTNNLTNEEKVFNSIGQASINLNISKHKLYEWCNNKNIINNIKYEFTSNTMNSSHPILSKLIDLNLNKKRAWEKFIPQQYLYSSIEDRIALLQGLMDTDGTIKKNGECSFSTTSELLANNISELVRSLGGRANPIVRNRIGKKNAVNGADVISRRVSYEFTISLPGNINPFSLSRKAMHHNPDKMPAKVRINSVEYVGEKQVQCIMVENPEHLYITDNFIVTHNTLQEKLGPWFQAIMDNFETLLSFKNGDNWKRELEMLQKKGLIEMEAITFIRGRSIPNAIILIDEAQNLSKEDMKTILTRAGEGTKIILTGDIEQIDNSDLDATNNGLTHVIEKFKESELAGHVTLTKGERSRLASKAAEIM